MLAGYEPPLTVAVHKVYGDVERLCLELVLRLHFDEPRDQDAAHSVLQIRLDWTESVTGRVKVCLGCEHVLRAVLSHVRDVLGVIVTLKVERLHLICQAEVRVQRRQTARMDLFYSQTDGAGRLHWFVVVFDE